MVASKLFFHFQLKYLQHTESKIRLSILKLSEKTLLAQVSLEIKHQISKRSVLDGHHAHSTRWHRQTNRELHTVQDTQEQRQVAAVTRWGRSTETPAHADTSLYQAKYIYIYRERIWRYSTARPPRHIPVMTLP